MGRRFAAVAVLLVAFVAVTPVERAEAQSVPKIWWGILRDVAAESAEVSTFYTQVSQNVAAALTVGYTIGGTATCGTDYTIAGADCAQGTGTFTIPAGTARFTNISFPITTLGDAVPDNGETVILSINAGAGYKLGSGTTATLTIVESSGQAAFRIGGQPQVNGTLTGHRVCDDPEGNGTVSYEWQRRATPARFGFARIPGATSQSYTLQQADSGHYIRLSVAYTDGNGVALRVFTPIVGPIGPVAAANTVGFSRGDYNVREGDSLRPTLTFSSPTAAEQTFEIVFQTCDADPRNDISSVDFAAPNPFVGVFNSSAAHSVTVPAGVTSHTFDLPVPADGEIEDYETFVMGFGAIPTGITIGSQQDATNQGQYAVVQIVNVSLVPEHWVLKPAGVGVGDQFRLLFKTHNERDGSADAIGAYDTFVRDRVAGAGTGHADIRRYSSTFRVVGSTPSVDAAWHTATGIMVGGEPSHTPFSTPVFWLNGPRIADDYNDFWDGTWDDNSPSAHRRADGNASTNTRGPNTGTRTGTTHATAGTKKPSRALGNSSNQTRWGGGVQSQNPIDQGDIPQSMNNVYVGLSGIFEVAELQLGWKRPPETATVQFGGHGREVNVRLPVPPGVNGNRVLFTISDGTARDNLQGSCGVDNDYDNHEDHGWVEHWHYRNLRAGGSVSIPIRLCTPSVGKNFKINWGDASPYNVPYPETSYDPDAPNCKADQQVIPARPYRAPRVEGHNRGVPIVDPGEPGRARQVNTVSWTCFTTVTVLASSGGDDSVSEDSVSAHDDAAPCDASEGVRRARAAFEWHMSYGSNAAMFWRILNTLGAEDLPAKPPGVTHDTITAQEARDFSDGNGWAGWVPINDALQRCTTADSDPDPVTPDPDPVTPDPEPDPVVSIAAGAGVTEGGDATFTVTASPAPPAPLTVDVSVSQSGDYGVTPGTRTVTIPTSGSATLTVGTTDDSADEADGQVTVAVDAGSGYTVSPTAGTATVAVADDDDPPPVIPQISITAGAGVTEGGDATFTVTASPAPPAPLTVDVSVSQSGDYGVTPGTRTVTIPTSGSATLTVGTTDDSADEADGQVTAAVDAGSGYTVSQSAGSATVAVSDDDDPPLPPVNATPSLSISDATASEGGTLTFTVTLSPASDRYAWVNYYARPAYGAALSATYADFAQAYGMLTFKPGETAKTVTVAAVDDHSPEGNETFTVVLYSAVQAAIADSEATGTITDND